MNPAGIGQGEEGVAFGEIGLDFYRNHSPREVQLARFRELLRLGRELDFPLSFTIGKPTKRLCEFWRKKEWVLERGFSLLLRRYRTWPGRVIQMGFYLSIPGTVTFQKSAVQQEVVRRNPPGEDPPGDRLPLPGPRTLPGEKKRAGLLSATRRKR